MSSSSRITLADLEKELITQGIYKMQQVPFLAFLGMERFFVEQSEFRILLCTLVLDFCLECFGCQSDRFLLDSVGMEGCSLYILMPGLSLVELRPFVA